MAIIEKEMNKMNKREQALEIIRIEYTEHGCSTLRSMRAYIENNISVEAYTEAKNAGINTYATNKEQKGGKGIKW